MGKEKVKDKNTSINNYFVFGNKLVSKKLVVIVSIIVFLIILIVGLYLINKSKTPTLYLNSRELGSFSGKAEVLAPKNVKDNKNKGKQEYYTIYKGYIVDGKYNGYGKLHDENGKTIYEGEFKDNKYNGKGMLYSDIHKLFYRGEFKDGLFEGSGTIFCYDKTKKYEGKFINAQMNGEGTYYQNGRIRYKGNFVNIKSCEEDNFIDGITGDGLMYYDDGKWAYKGNFLSGKFNGQGELYNDDEESSPLYKGNFLNGQYDGVGKLFEKNTGFMYDGEFKNGKYNGQGTLYYKDSSLKVFSGSFSDGSIDNFSLMGIPFSELKSKFSSLPQTEVHGRYMYLTYKETGTTFVLDAVSDVQSSEEIGKSKVDEIILWKYSKFAGIPYGSYENGFENVLGKPLYRGITEPVYKDRIALKNIKEDEIKEVAYIAAFNYREYCITAVFPNEDQENLYITISE